jgi:hypothetical protein
LRLAIGLSSPPAANTPTGYREPRNSGQQQAGTAAGRDATGRRNAKLSTAELEHAERKPQGETRPGSAARDVTGRVLEAGNGQISVPGACQPGAQLPLPPLMSPEAADALLPRVLASAAPPPALLTPLLNPG